jgi:hypothetical protein
MTMKAHNSIKQENPSPDRAGILFVFEHALRQTQAHKTKRLRRKRETAPEKSYGLFNGTMFASAAAFK